MTKTKKEETFRVDGAGLLKKFKELVKEGNKTTSEVEKVVINNYLLT